MSNRFLVKFYDIKRGVKGYYRSVKKKWRTQPEKHRYYVLLAIFSILLLPCLAFINILPRDLPDTLIGLIGATTIFIFHEYIKIQALELENNASKLRSYSWYPTGFLVIIDILITAPMLPFDNFSQQYTGLLIYIIVFSIFMHGTSKLYYLLYKWVKLTDDDKERIENNSKRRNERYKKRSRKWTKWVNKHIYRGKLPEVPEEAYKPLDRFSEKTTKIMIVLKKLLLNYPALTLLVFSGIFLLTLFEVIARSLLNLFTHPEVPLEMKVLIAPTIVIISILIISNLYINRRIININT